MVFWGCVEHTGEVCESFHRFSSVFIVCVGRESGKKIFFSPTIKFRCGREFFLKKVKKNCRTHSFNQHHFTLIVQHKKICFKNLNNALKRVFFLSFFCLFFLWLLLIFLMSRLRKGNFSATPLKICCVGMVEWNGNFFLRGFFTTIYTVVIFSHFKAENVGEVNVWRCFWVCKVEFLLFFFYFSIYLIALKHQKNVIAALAQLLLLLSLSC